MSLYLLNKVITYH